MKRGDQIGDHRFVARLPGKFGGLDDYPTGLVRQMCSNQLAPLGFRAVAQSRERV